MNALFTPGAVRGGLAEVSAPSRHRKAGLKRLGPSPWVSAGLVIAALVHPALAGTFVCSPPVVQLSSAASSQQIVIQAIADDGITRDVTGSASCTVLDPKIAQLSAAEGKLTLLPVNDGTTQLQVVLEGRTNHLPVTVTNCNFKPAVSFNKDVMPVLMKAGCNSGGCHGTSRGKDGFHLSLFGFDPEGDYRRLTREQIGRRINLAIPEESLILQKGLGAVPHTGGTRFATNSELYSLLVRWLADGATNDPPTVAKVTDIEIFPKSAVLEGSNSVQQFIVQARYSDSTLRDVTSLAVFLSNNEVTARAGENGKVVSGQRREAFVQARFAEFNVGAQVIVIPKDLPYAWPGGIASTNAVDQAVFAKLKKLRLLPSETCDDATFIRRASLDIAGRLPSPAELRSFLENKEATKRERLIDELLSRKEFAEIWVMKLAELLQIRSRDNQVYPKAALLYFEWLRDQMLTNVPLDRIVQNLLTASGGTLRQPAANYFQVETDTLKLTENTAQVFMGMRIQCAQCHNHPFDRWTMNDYYSFAAFFSQVGRKPGEDPRETVVFDRPDGEVKHPVTGAAMKPKFLGGSVPDIKNETRRHSLASWLTSAQNPYFARNLANIVWAHFLGRGIVEPVDDVRLSNPPSNPELLEALAAKLVEYRYDLKRLVRDICLSRTYQLSTRPNDTNALDDRNFSKASLRRIRAETLLDCISQVTETQDKFPGLPKGARAVEIADGNTETYFLTTFGRASRTTVCSCEVKIDPNLSQALHLLNGETVQQKIAEGGVVKRWLKEGKTNDQIIEDLYLRCLSRSPTPQEAEKLRAFFKEGANAEQVLDDLFWSLLNSKEFVFNH